MKFRLPQRDYLVRVLRSVPAVAWLTHIVVVFSTAALTVRWSPSRDSKRPQFEGIAHYLVSPLSLWDGGWYVRVAREGYGRHRMTAAFWPLYPSVLRAGHALTGLSYEAVGVLTSNFFFLGALSVLFMVVRSEYGPKVANRTVWLTALGPVSFFFSAVYTESLFLLLTISAIALALKGKWTGTALVAALAVLTRNTGELILVPLALILIQQRGRDPRRWWREGVQLAAAATTPLAFARQLDRLWDDPLLMMHIQSKWNREFSWPWLTLIRGFRRMELIYATGRHDCRLSLHGSALRACQTGLRLQADHLADDLALFTTLGCLVLIGFAFTRLKPRDSVYLCLAFVAPLFGPGKDDRLVSMPRYLLVVFPLFIVAALLLRKRWMFVGVLILSTLLMIGLLSLFARSYFVA